MQGWQHRIADQIILEGQDGRQLIAFKLKLHAEEFGVRYRFKHSADFA